MAKVLVVDDMPDNVKLLNYDLSDSGFKVLSAESGKDALEQARNQQPDVILLDVAMPGMDGIEVCRRLKGDPLTENIPVIMISAMGEEDVIIRALDTGAQDYVTKPFSIQIVLARVRSAIRLKTGHDTIVKMNKRLAELNETAHQFVDNVSHEFRTPLTVIKEFSSIMIDGLAGELTDDQAEYLDIIANRVDDLSFMVNDMLDISKLEAGLLTVSRKPCDVSDIIERVKTTLERKAKAKKASLIISIPPDLPKVRCDMEKIGRVIINLVVNAIKFVDEGGRVELKAYQGEDKTQVIISVTDDGPGIAEENLKAIFDRFKQVEGNIRASTKGFGLGLNIAKELVQMNLGEMSVKSELGNGSTFSLTVPIAEPLEYIKHYLSKPGLFRPDAHYIALLGTSVSERSSSHLYEEVEEFLLHLTRKDDLLFNTTPNTWLLITVTNQADTTSIASRIRKAWVEANRNRPTGPLPDIELQELGVWEHSIDQTAFLQRFVEEMKTKTSIENTQPSMQT